LDLSETSIVPYSGTEGTLYGHYDIYLANKMPISSFENKQSLTSLSLPLSLTAIDLFSFSQCNGLNEEFVFPPNLVFIADSAFAGCIGLSGNLQFPLNLTAIGTAAFSGCRNISSLYLPSSLSLIRQRAFEFCDGLQTLTNMSQTPIQIDESVFTGVDKAACTLKVPRNSIDLYKNSLVWQDFFYDQDDVYAVTVAIKNPYGRALGEGIYNAHSTVTLTAIANTGHEFLHWAVTTDSLRGDAVVKWDSIISTDYSLQFLITRDTTFVLNFKKKETNIKEIDDNTSILYVYPNPVGNELFINCSLPIKQIMLYDIVGKKLKQWTLPTNRIETGDLSKGIYFLEIHTEDKSFLRKIAKN